MAKAKMLDWLADERRATIWSREDDKTRIESRQDAEPLIEFVKNRAQVPDDKDYKFLGVIPEATLNQAFNEGWFHDRASWVKWLEENPKFSAKWHR